MCGIVGMISKATNGFQHDEKETFREMLVMDQVRGMDGTGVMGVFHNRQCSVAKIGTNASNFIDMEAYKKFEGKIFHQFWAVFGHNRKATQGSISSKNSHPFVSDNIVLIHNGTLNNHKQIADTDVDSEAIAVGLNKEEASTFLGKLHGAYALVWYDKRDKRIHVARNDERPLYIAETPNSWLFCSETGIMLAASYRNRIKPTDIEPIEVGTIFSFKSGKEYEYEKIIKSYTTYPRTKWDYEEAIPFARGPSPTTPPARVATPAHLPTKPGRLVIPPASNTTTPFPALADKRAEIKATVDKLLKPISNKTIPAVGSEVCWAVERIIPTSRATMDNKIIQKGWEVHGKINRDGIDVDVIGFCTWPTSIDDLEKHIGYSRDERGTRWVSGTVVDSGSTNCGPWVRCDDVTGETFVKVWNTKTLPRVIWNEVVKGHVCDKCHAPISAMAADYTSVNYSGYGKINKLTCASCVDKSVVIPNKDTKDASIVSDSVQDGEQQQQAPNPTIH